MSTVQETINAQNTYTGIMAWHNANIKGSGVVVWNTEGAGTHGDTCTTRILNAAPNATVIRASLSMVSNATAVTTHTCTYQGVTYDIEDFIDQFNVNIVTRSTGGTTTPNTPQSVYWNDLKNRYNLTFFSSAGNEGSGSADTLTCAFPSDVAYYIGACNLTNGNPVRANYSSIGAELDFMNLTGVWSGTSFAAPYTAGEAALLKGRYGLDMNHEEIFKYLKFVCYDLVANGVGFDNYSGWGIPRFRAIDKTYITLDVGNTTYKVDGVAKTMDTAPVNNQGNVFVPLRVIAEGLGKTVNWVMNANNSITVTITDGTNTVVITTGSTSMRVNGATVILNFAPYLDANNRTLVPVRAIAEAFNCNVDWIQSKERVMILEK